MTEIRSDEQWKREVKKRDGCCRLCGETINRHAHHIKPRSKYPELEWELDNGITLCGNHHAHLKGKEESINLRVIIPDEQIADQLKRLNGIFCNYLLLKLDNTDGRNEGAFQLFGHLQLYPDSLDQFIPVIQRFLNENRLDVGLAEQMVVDFFRCNSNNMVSRIIIEYEERLDAERHRQGAEPEEVTELRLLVEAGDAAAECYIRGWRYANGRGVTQNDEKAVECYQKAAEQGHAIAQYDLSWMYEYGRGISPNSSVAVKWCRKAAEQGYADAQNTLGWRYQYVRGVGAQNYDEAIKWYGKAAEQGHADAQANLRELSARLGAPRARNQQIDTDDAEAVTLDYRATEQNNIPEQSNVRGFGRNNVRTFWHYQEAAQRGDTTAQNNIGVMYANGRGVDQDYDEAINWFRQAAQHGNTTAHNNLCRVYIHRGWRYANGRGVDQDDTQAFNWFRQAVLQGDAEAQNIVGWMYAQGRGIDQDYAQAFAWFSKAAEQGHAEAQYNLGVMYARGDHVLHDGVEAVEWLRRAAEQGDTEARSTLRKLLNDGCG